MDAQPTFSMGDYLRAITGWFHTCVLAESYGAGVRPMDFGGAPEESRVTINDWVAVRTEDRIKDLFPPGVINPFTRMVLTNAIYFNAAWFTPSTKARTALRPFHLLDRGEVDVPMMRTTAGGWEHLLLLELFLSVITSMELKESEC